MLWIFPMACSARRKSLTSKATTSTSASMVSITTETGCMIARIQAVNGHQTVYSPPSTRATPTAIPMTPATQTHLQTVATPTSRQTVAIPTAPRQSLHRQWDESGGVQIDGQNTNHSTMHFMTTTAPATWSCSPCTTTRGQWLHPSARRRKHLDQAHMVMVTALRDTICQPHKPWPTQLSGQLKAMSCFRPHRLPRPLRSFRPA